MKGYVKQGRVTRQQFIDLLRKLFPQRCYYLAQRADDCRFHFYNPGEAGWLADHWTEGRVFSSEAEVRWRKLGAEGFEVMALAEEDIGLEPFGLEPDGIEWQAVKREGARGGIYLWGAYREDLGRWVETRIPRRLFYPVEEDRKEGRFVRLSHVDYYAPNGAVQFVRLTDLS